MPQSCGLCYSAPAAVFRPTIALCRSCYAEVQRVEAEDNACANVEFCPCGTARNQAGVCPSCAAEAARASYRYMAVHG